MVAAQLKLTVAEATAASLQKQLARAQERLEARAESVAQYNAVRSANKSLQKLADQRKEQLTTAQKSMSEIRNQHKSDQLQLQSQLAETEAEQEQLAQEAEALRLGGSERAPQHSTGWKAEEALQLRMKRQRHREA